MITKKKETTALLSVVSLCKLLCINCVCNDYCMITPLSSVGF